MKILLDTHIFLWSLLTPAKLRDETLELLTDDSFEKYLSAASYWEMAIKYAKGALTLPGRPIECIHVGVAAAGIIPLQIRPNDVLAVADLPAHHNDPFDRLMITQAKLNKMYILTNDPEFDKYEVDLIDG